MKKSKTLLEAFPELAAQWHPTKNGGLTPEQVSPKSNKKVWWLFHYKDPKTGKEFDFEWKSSISDRAAGSGCPFLVGKKVWPGFNDLGTTHPDLVAEWHPTKNGSLTPEQVSAGSNKKVWWIYSFKNSRTGKCHSIEWQSPICNRAKGRGCPVLKENKVQPGVNDLETLYPELAEQWHPTKNEYLAPDIVTAVSQKKVWWLLHYKDAASGKEFDFEWKSRICVRTSGCGCPYLTGAKVWPGFNDIGTTHPEIAKQWHPKKNRDLTPQDVSAGSNKNVWWFYSYDDPKTQRHFDFEWKATVNNRTKNSECPFISGSAVWPGYNDLATVRPEISAQWHPIKNGSLRPRDVFAGSKRIVWWYYPFDDPVSGKHFEFEWQQMVRHRAREGASECPFLSNLKVWKGFNDLASIRPDLALQWHPTKNGNVTPEDVTVGSDFLAWWYYPFDDPVSGKHFDFEWEADVFTKASSKTECPYLANDLVWPGYNDLKTLYPEIAAQWHPTRNGELTPEQITPGSHSRAWWYMPYDDPSTGRHFNFEWESTVAGRVASKSECPYLTNDLVWPGYNDLKTLYPEIAAQWHPEKNHGLTADKILAGGNQWGYWTMAYDDPETGKHYDFKWLATVSGRIRTPDCPFLKNLDVWTGYNDLLSCFPEVAAEWHPERNRTTPDKVMKYSHQKVWWRCQHGHEWRTSVSCRTKKGSGCPFCQKMRRRYGIWTD